MKSFVLFVMAMSVCWGACGKGVDDSGHTGDPLVTFLGRTEGTLSADLPATAVRAALIWSRYDPAVVDCFRNTPDNLQAFFNCGTTNVMIPDPASQVVKLEANFPVSFTLPLFELPESSLLNGAEGSYLGLGRLDIFNDGNGNNQLDVVSLEATSSFDALLAASDYEIIYREGELSPLWRSYSIFGCPEPPQGFSILHWDTEAPPVCDGLPMCVPPCGILDLSAEQVLKLGAVTQYDQQRLCQPGLAQGKILAPDTQPDASAQAQCSESGWDLFVNAYPDRFCTEANTVQYSLLDYINQSWDLRQTPPAWWPCEVKIDNTQEYPIVGVYQVSAHTMNAAGCDVEGAPVGIDPPVMSIVKDDVMTQLAMQTIVGLHRCRSASDCDADIDASWGYLGWMEGAWRGEQPTFEALPNNQCSLTALMVNVTLVNGVLRIERRMLAGVVTLGAGEVCDMSLYGTHAGEMTCGSLEVFTANPIQ